MVGFLFKQYTLAALCNRQAKASLLVGFASTSICSFVLYFAPNWWITVLPSLACLTMFGGEIVGFTSKIENSGWCVKKVAWVSVGILGIALQLCLCGILYRNYLNSQI